MLRVTHVVSAFLRVYVRTAKSHIVSQITVDWLENPRIRRKLFGIRDWKGGIEGRFGTSLDLIRGLSEQLSSIGN